MDKTKITPSKISIGMWMVLIGVAGFFDVLEAVFVFGVIIGTLIDMFAFAIFWLIFKMNGEKYSRKTMTAGAIIGFIPILNVLPECTATMVKLYLDAKKRNALAKEQEKKVAAEAQKNKRIVAQNIPVREEAQQTPQEETRTKEKQKNQSTASGRRTEEVEAESELYDENSEEGKNQNADDSNPQQTEFGEIYGNNIPQPDETTNRVSQNRERERSAEENAKHFHRIAPQRETNTQTHGQNTDQQAPQNNDDLEEAA